MHRDLKPTNVLLGADGPRVIDFGIAYATEASSLTGTNVVIGSPGYLSPEQAEPNRRVGPASDIFALGAVLCYAATGHGPWGTGSTAALIYRVVHGEPDIADVPDEIRSLVARCMAKLPMQRPTAADILAEVGDPELLSGWLAQGNIEASRPARPSGAAALGQPAWVASSASSGPPAAAAVALDDTIGRGMTYGVLAGNTAPGGGAPVRHSYPSAHQTDARGRIRPLQRRLMLLAAAAAAAAVLVPFIFTQAQSGPGSKGHAPAHIVTPSPPALVGVYSGPGYGFNNPNSIGADGSHVWVLNGGNDSVTELGARTGAWMQTLSAARYGFESTSDDSAGIVDDGTDVWVGNLDSVTEINAGNGSLVRTLRIPADANLHGWYSALVRAGTELWGATPNTCRPYCSSSTNTGDYASLIEFNASDGNYVRVLTRKTAQIPIALASDGTHVWFAASNFSSHRPNGRDIAGTVTQFNASDGRPIWSIPVKIYNDPQVTTPADSIAYSAGRLWLANGQYVTELNASNGELVRVLSGERFHFTGKMAIAAAGKNVFVVNGGGNSVTEIDASTGAIVYTMTAARYHLDNPAGIAVVGNHAWIINSPSGRPSSVVEVALGAG